MSDAKVRSGITRAALNEAKRAALVEDVEFLLSCHVGEAHILHSTGYTTKPGALRRRLERCGRFDLIPRIFEWEAATEEQKHPTQPPARKRIAA